MITRIKSPPRRFAFLHFIISSVIALLCAVLVFFVWYPYPYYDLSGGKDLFILLVSVDVISGPLITLIVYDPKKSRTKLLFDLCVVFIIQLAALGYGLFNMALARPILVAFERDQFRVVTLSDINNDDMRYAPKELSESSLLGGPKLAVVNVPEFTDKNYLESVLLSIEGLYPAFRPRLWLSYEQQKSQAIRKAKLISDLKNKVPDQVDLIEGVIRESGFSECELGYLPLSGWKSADWVVLISLKDGKPKLYLPISGW